MKASKIPMAAIFISLIFLLSASLPAWRPPLLIAGNDGKVYERPGMCVPASGEVYITFQVRTLDMQSHIPLYKYDGETVTLLKVVSDESPASRSTYFPNVAVSDAGEIHVAWAEYTKGAQGTQYIKYRFFDGETWRPAELLATVTQSNFCEDLRIACDSERNAFVVFYDSTNGRCHFISKYYGQAPQDSFPLSGRSKHADVACDDDYVYLAWQHQLTPDYGILYQKRENKPDGAWLPAINLNTYYTQRPSLALDDDRNPHIAFWRDYGNTRELYYRPGGEANLGDATLNKLLSAPPPRSYHFADLSVRGDSRFVSWQVGDTRGGEAAYYNWYRNGAWSGQALLPGAALPALIVSGLSPDGANPIVVYPSGDKAIYLISHEKVTPGALPVPAFTSDRSELFWGGSDTISFDASASTPAPGATLSRYLWQFAGTVKEGMKVTYTSAEIKEYGDVQVTLTVQDDRNARASLRQTVRVTALYTPEITSLREVHVRTAVFDRLGTEIRWQPNPRNAAYAISGYRVYRRDDSGGDEFAPIGDAKPGALFFVDATRLQGRSYSYGVAAVDDQGRVSPLDHVAEAASGSRFTPRRGDSRPEIL